MNDKAYQKGKTAYEMMKNACEHLISSGHWQRVGTSDVNLFLDMYTQSLLLRMAQNVHVLPHDMQNFIASIPDKDVLSIGRLGTDAALNIGHKNRSFAEGTPLLLRCCVAMDDKDGTNYAQMFVDGVTRLLYAAAESDGDMNGDELQFITSYAGQLRTFLMSRTAGKYASKYEDNTREEAAKTVQADPSNVSAKEKKEKEQEDCLETLLSELDALIGLKQVKKEVYALINLIKVRELRKKHGLKVMDMSFHMVFTGNPGTGKTTVARLISKIYKQLGFLSKGHLVETDRSGLVAGYVGQTAGKVSEVVESALGGILFIDEAYALARKGMENDFGREAIDTLVKLMEDHRDDFVVIVAGYTSEMHDFLTSNPGLISRFNKYIDFPDYTNDELMDILRMNATRQGYTLDEAAQETVKAFLAGMPIEARMDFGNARGMRNTLEKLVQAQANRLANEEVEISKQMLEIITGEDAKAALNENEKAGDTSFEIPLGLCPLE